MKQNEQNASATERRFEQWASVNYRNADSYTHADYAHGLEGWRAGGADALAEATALMPTVFVDAFKRGGGDEFLDGMAYGVAAYCAAIKALAQAPAQADQMRANLLTSSGRSPQVTDADWALMIKRYEDAGDRKNADIVRKQRDVARGVSAAQRYPDHATGADREPACESCNLTMGETLMLYALRQGALVLAQAQDETLPRGSVRAGLDLMARGADGMIKALGIGQGEIDAGNPVSAQVLDLGEVRQDMLRTIIAAAYQVAAAHDAPAHILDVLADPEGATADQVNAMLPYQPAQRQAQDAVACKCGRILAVCLATSCEHSELALVQRETAGDAGAAPTCRSSEKAQVMQEQSGAGLARQSTESGASLAPAPPQSVDSLVAMLVDRDTPPGMDDEVVDWDLHGKPITHRMVESFSKTAPRSDQLALELPTGAPIIRNVGAAIDAAAAEAASHGVAGLNLPANRARATVLDEEMLATALWLYRRLHRCYGRPPTVERPIKALAALVGIDVADCLAERGPDPMDRGPL